MYLEVIWIVCEPWCPLVRNTWLCQVMSCCGAQFDWCTWMGPGSSWHCNNPGKLKRQFSMSTPEKLGTLCESEPAKIAGLAWVKREAAVHCQPLCTQDWLQKALPGALTDVGLCFIPCSAPQTSLGRSWGWGWQPCPEATRLHSEQLPCFCCVGIFQHLAADFTGNWASGRKQRICPNRQHLKINK